MIAVWGPCCGCPAGCNMLAGVAVTGTAGLQPVVMAVPLNRLRNWEASYLCFLICGQGLSTWSINMLACRLTAALPAFSHPLLSSHGLHSGQRIPPNRIGSCCPSLESQCPGHLPCIARSCPMRPAPVSRLFCQHHPCSQFKLWSCCPPFWTLSP